MPNDSRGDALMSAWFAAVGDVMLQHRPANISPALIELLSSAETALANVESPFTGRGVPAEKVIVQRSHPDRADDVAALGVDVATVANNHLLDYGVEGMDDTLAALTAAGVVPVGAGENDDAARAPTVRTTASGSVAVLGLSAALPPGFAAAADRPGVAPLRVLQRVAIDPVLAAEQPGMAPYVHTTAVPDDVDAACAVVAEAGAAADLVVVAVHWGVPHGFAAPSYGTLAEYQRPAGRALIEAGAHLVIGHHPHEVHPVEIHDGGLIAYSVGNFLFHAWSDLAGDGSADARFPMRVPAAPYRSAFGDDVTHDSVVVLVAPPENTAAERLTVRFIPTTMATGEPVLATDDRARAIIARLGLDTVTPRDDLLPGTTIGEVHIDHV